MIENKKFFVLYSISAFTLFFLLLFIIFIFSDYFTFPGLENNKELKGECIITYVEGEETYYRQKGKYQKTLSYNDEIRKKISLETGQDSYIGLYIKDQGYYFLYPNTSLYIEELNNFLLKKYQKQSIFILEKGLLYSDLNSFSKNSLIIVKTDDSLLKLTKSKLLIDKTEDFKTRFYCFEGFINFRPNSNKFEFFESKKVYDISASIERLLNTNNILYEGYFSVIDINEQKKLDSIITRIYESKNTKFINADFIKSSLTIPVYSIEDINFMLPESDITKFNFNNGFVEFTSFKENDLYFNNSRLKHNKKYIFNKEAGSLTMTQDLGFTEVIYEGKLGEKEYKPINLKEFHGIKNISINEKRVNYIVNRDIINLNIKNFILCEPTEKFDNIRNINIKTDLSIQKVLFLFEKEKSINNFFKIGNIDINEKNYFIYDYGFDDNKNIYINLNENFKDEKIKILLIFEERYYYDI